VKDHAMSVQSNGTHPAPVNSGSTPRCPRRVVLLKGDDQSGVEKVLAEFEGAQVSGRRLHEEIRQLATRHPGRRLAAEWHGSLGWTRFLWCSRP
jgi:hypothetical protein